MAKNLPKSIIFAVVILFAATLAVADVVIVEFHAAAGYNRVELTWKVSQETNVSGYQIQRSTDGQSFVAIDFVKATPASASPASPKSYQYVDRTIFKPTGRTFYYRLGVKDADSDEIVSYSPTAVVSPQISGVHHTWGSIKAMFR